MNYDFNAPVDRTHAFSAKYDELHKKFGRTDLIPLWIADMDLPTAQPILDAIDARNKQGLFGYTSRPDSYFDALCAWQQRRNGWTIDKTLLSFAVGVVPALSAIVKECTKQGDHILIQTPVYSEFFSVIEDWQRIPICCPLTETDGTYAIDFKAFEAALAKKPALFILCNPHNPVGRVWNAEELSRMGQLCKQYGVLVVSDEIHSDLMLFGNRHIPFASLGTGFAQNTITCLSATKTFNLAGLQAAAVVFPNAELKKKYDTFWSRLDIHRNNCFSLVAVEAAFRDGEDWLLQLLRHIEQNMLFVHEYLKQHIPLVKAQLPQSTYLMWLDCRALDLPGDSLKDFFINQARLGLNDGRDFGASDGFMRLNVACPQPVLKKALEQLRQAVNALRG